MPVVTRFEAVASVDVRTSADPPLLRDATFSRKLKYDRRGHQNELAGDAHSNATAPPPSALTVDTGANSSTLTDDTPVSLGLEVVGSENIDMVAYLFTYSYIFYSPWSSIGSNMFNRSGGPSLV